jgi:hypothetical protein
MCHINVHKIITVVLNVSHLLTNYSEIAVWYLDITKQCRWTSPLVRVRYEVRRSYKQYVTI